MNSNERIVVNTIIVYVRMAIEILVGLFSSRYVLLALGVSDFGLYNVVAGLITMLNFVSTAMATTTRRYINYEMGRGGDLNRVFSISFVLHIGFALLIFLLAETIGLYYIYNYLNVEEGRLGDALIVFHISTSVACIGIMNIPFQALFEAYEKFLSVSIISIITALLKLVLAISLLYVLGDKLILYASGICIISLISFLLYTLGCKRNWGSVVKVRFIRKDPLYKEIISFNNYTALGAAASICSGQGSKLILNYFFNTAVNGAFAIANQIESYIYQLAGKLTVASMPQVTQSYANGNHQRSIHLTEAMSRYSVLLVSLFVFPFLSELHTLLKIWLINVPPLAYEFSVCTLICVLVRSFGEGFNGIIQASGKVKHFQVLSAITNISIIPISYFLFKIGFSPVTITVLFIVSNLTYNLISFYFMRKLLNIDIAFFLREAYLNPMIIIGLMSVICVLYCKLMTSETVIYHLIGLFFVFIITLLLVFEIGLKKEEKKKVCNLLVKKINGK